MAEKREVLIEARATVTPKYSKSLGSILLLEASHHMNCLTTLFSYPCQNFPSRGNPLLFGVVVIFPCQVVFALFHW